jgi:hypothetical protein
MGMALGGLRALDPPEAAVVNTVLPIPATDSTITGPRANRLAISGNHASGVFQVGRGGGAKQIAVRSLWPAILNLAV